MAEYIEAKDVLNQGRKKINEFAIAPALRAEQNSNKAIQKANETTAIAQSANQKAESVEKRLENVIIESGTSDAETVDARTDELGNQNASLKSRLDKTDAVSRVYQSIDEIKQAKVTEAGIILKAQIDGTFQNFKVLDDGKANDVSVLLMANGKYAHRVFDTYNDWLQGFKNKSYATHKGFSGVHSGAKLGGLYPGNTVKSFEQAGKLGYGMVELDVQNCLNDWIVIHDGNTATLENGSETELISALSAENIVSRKIVKEYVTGGYYWNYSGLAAGYSAPLLKDVLNVCKKYGMYILIEIKATSATNEQIENLATIIRNSGVEEKCIIFGSNDDVKIKVLALLKNSIYGAIVGTDSDLRHINLLKSFKNHFVSMNIESSDSTYQFLKDNNIPFGVWTVDDYQQAEKAFNKGAMTVTTDRLMVEPTFNDYKLVKSYTKYDLVSEFKNNGSGGTTEIDSNGDVHISASGTYFSKMLTLLTDNLSAGQIVRVKCTAKTNSAAPETNVGRIYVYNGGSSTNLTYIEDIMKFDTNYYQTKEMSFPIGHGNVVNNLAISVGFSGQGVAGLGEMEIKDFSLEIYSPKKANTSRERYGYIFAYDIPPAIRPEMAVSGITNVSVSTDDPSTILVDYVPFFDQTKKPIVLTDVDAYGQKIMRQVKVKSLDSPHGQLALNIYESDGTKVSDVRTGMRMGFSILIKI